MTTPGVRERRALVAGAIALLIVALFHQAVLAGEVFFQRDVQLMWMTQVSWMRRALALGSAPLWNPYIGFGQPLLADANTQVFYPTTALALALPPWTGYTLIVLLHVGLAAAGMYRLARRLELSRGAALFGAAVLCAGGPLVSLASVWNQLCAAAWLPWVLIGADRAARSGRFRDVPAWAIPLALQLLAGGPEMALAGAVASGAWLAVATHARAAGAPRWGRAAAIGAASAGLALALAAVQWLPSLSAARDATRATMPEEMRLYMSLHPASLLEMGLPARLASLPLTSVARAAVFDSWDPLVASVYLGIATLPFAAAGLVGRRYGALAAAAFFAFLVVALGRHTPLGSLGASIPGLAMFRFPVKAVVPAAVAWAMACALGYGALVQARGKARAVAVVAAGAAALAVAAALFLASRGAWPDLFLAGSLGSAAAASTLTRGVAVAMATLVLLAVGSRRAVAGAALLAIGDLIASHHALEPTAPVALYRHTPPLLRAIEGPDPRLYVQDYFVRGASQRLLGRDVPYLLARAPVGWRQEAAQAFGLRQTLFPPTAGVHGVAGSFDTDISGMAPLPTGWLRALLLGWEGTPAQVRLLQRAGVTHAVTLHQHGLDALTPAAADPGLLLEPALLWKVPTPLPRAYVASGTQIADDATAAHLLADGSFDPEASVVLPGGEARRPAGRVGTARVVSRDGSTVSIHAHLDAPGHLVLLEAWAPGWTARVDGQRDVEVARANLAFRAVALGQGSHQVRMQYRAPGLLAGAIISLAGLAAVVALRRGSGGLIEV